MPALNDGARMMHDYNSIWDIYTASWRAESREEKLTLFGSCLDQQNVYTDPMTIVTGWDELIEYMLEFQQQIPGGHFITRSFLSHHQQSVAHWEMRNATHKIIGQGISHARYNPQGLLLSETGFFSIP